MEEVIETRKPRNPAPGNLSTTWWDPPLLLELVLLRVSLCAKKKKKEVSFDKYIMNRRKTWNLESEREGEGGKKWNTKRGRWSEKEAIDIKGQHAQVFASSSFIRNVGEYNRRAAVAKRRVEIDSVCALIEKRNEFQLYYYIFLAEATRVFNGYRLPCSLVIWLLWDILYVEMFFKLLFYEIL